MRKMIWLLALLCCAATVAMAGPNAGGVLWVHNTGTAFTAAPVFGADPAVCPTSINTQMPLWDGVTPAAAVSMYWKVYAAFPAGSSPRLKSVAWQAEFPEVGTSPNSYVNVTNGDRVPGETSATVFFIGGAGFPTASSGSIGQSFPPGARTTLVTPLFMFWGWGYGATPTNPTWSLGPKTGDDNFGDDNIPANTDQIAGYGSLGFGVPGHVPCPVLPQIMGGCCNPSTGACAPSLPLDCQAPSVWQWQTCNPNPCPQPTGACCNAAAGMPSCVIATPADCATYLPVRVWLGAATVCNTTTCPVPPPVGACCNTAMGMPDCTITTQAACIAPLVWLGAGIPCDATTCPVPIGSCCFPDGTCSVTTEAQCAAGPTDLTQIADRRLTKAARRVPGIWTEGGTCNPNLCVQPPATGACCNVAVGFPACNIMTAAECQALGSAWLYVGDNVACNVQTCPVPGPTGACCNVLTGDCTITTAAACQFSWLGAGVPCNTVTCPAPPPPTGACCDRVLGYPACTITTQADCLAPLAWLGANVPCDVLTCPPPPPPVTGACCNVAVGMPDCHITTQVECLAPYTWLGADVPCNVQTCPVPVVPTGACCNQATGACTITTHIDCAFAWLGADVPCNIQTCPPPPPPEGACCWLDGHCTIATEVGCAGDGTPHWTLNGVCSPNPCDQPPPVTGACCWLDGHCTVTTEAGCLGTGTPHWTLGGTCDPNNCVPPVPTERTSWGQIKNIYR